jgi:hypothetical protein
MQIGGFFADGESRRKACAAEKASDVAACIEGAGVAHTTVQTGKPD